MNARERYLSIAMCILAGVLPLMLGVASNLELRVEGGLGVSIVFLIVCSLTLLSALHSYLADLKFYSKNSMDEDSGVELHVKSPGGAAGNKRLHFYYPFTIGTASLGVVLSALFIWR